MVAIHGNRVILHRVFRRLPSNILDDPTVEFEPIKDLARQVALEELAAVTNAVHELFPDCYIASLFKNFNRCRAVDTHLGARRLGGVARANGHRSNVHDTNMTVEDS